MAIRSIAQLKAWFKRGSYPTEAQFADWIDSFFHKEEDKIPISSVDELPARLNDKYNTADAAVLEKKTQQVVEDLAAHRKAYAEEVDAIHTNLEELEAEAERLDGRITAETTRATDEEAAIRREMAIGDDTTLRSAKGYTDARETAIREDMEAGDSATLSAAKAFTAEREGVLRSEMQEGDASTLQSANDYTDGRERAIREEMTAGDDATLAAAKAFTEEREGVLRSETQAGDAATLASANDYTDGRETAIREEMTAGNAATLQSAKSYTNTREAAVRKELASGDAATLRSANDYTDERETAIREELASGDAATLRSANDYTDGRETAIREELTAGDAATLQSAKSYTNTREAAVRSDISSGNASTLAAAKKYADDKIADVVGGSPETLDTLKELSAALGDDPNFAATVAGQIGGKVDKVAGKGLSTEDFTSAEKQKLAGITAGANAYSHPSSHPASMITEDATHRFVTDTEKSAWNAKASTSAATQSANGLMTAADKKKLDGIAAGANNYTHPASHPASMITTDETHRFITDAERDAWNSKPGAGTATGSSSGLMSAADKKKLDGIAAGANNYIHPASHPATIITEDATHRFVTDTEKSAWNAKAAATAATQSAMGLMSAADKKKLDGIATGANAYSHPTSHPASMIATDETHQFVTATEKSAWNAKAAATAATQSANGLMTAADKKKLDGIAAGANAYTHPASHPATIIATDEMHQFVTAAEKSAWNGKASTSAATQSANGLMTAADKKKLDGISSDAINMLGEDYEEVPDFNPTGMNVDFFKVKFVPGFIIIHAQVAFQTKVARFTTPAYAIQSRAIIETYVSFVEVLNTSHAVKIIMGGNTETTSFMFQVPDEVLNAPVIFHCAIPVLSVARF